MMNTLELKNVEKNFRRKKVLNDISYSFESGVYGLLGPNGAGKTTLMRCIAALYQCTGGDILHNDSSIYKLKHYGKDMGYLPQKFGLFKELTVWEIMCYFAGLKEIEGDVGERINECLELVNLEDKKDTRCKKLSGGMVRRLGIAQAILGNPHIILFDEPTAGLDPEERLRFKMIINNLSKDTIVIVSTHIVEDVEAVCNKIILMNEGKFLEALPTKDIKTIAENKVYEVPAEELDKLSGKYYVVKQYEKNDSVMYRVLTAQEQQFTMLKPTVEDGYLCRIKEI